MPNKIVYIDVKREKSEISVNITSIGILKPQYQLIPAKSIDTTDILTRWNQRII